MHIAYVIVVGHACLAVLLSWAYFRKARVTRPPIGVFNGRDIAIILIGIATVPYLYLILPLAAVAALLGVITLGAVYFTLEPVVSRKSFLWVITATLVGGDVILGLASTTGARSALALNNLVLVVAIVGVANLWAQSGMKARHATALAGGLIVYDAWATWQVGVMGEIFTRLESVPLLPFVTWPAGAGRLGIGLGDILVASLFPIVMRKAFGRTAGIAAILLALTPIAAVTGLIALGFLEGPIPAMVVLGPLMLAQYRYWSRSLGEERAMWQYLREEPPAPRDVAVPRLRRSGNSSAPQANRG